MSAIDRQVRLARFRLNLNLLLERMAFGLLVGAAAWSAVLIAERAFVLGVPLGAALAGAAFVGLTIAVVGTLLTAVEPLRAAIAIDRAAGLKERISTAVAIRRDGDAFARAAVHDAEQAAGRVHVPSLVPYRAPGLWPWSASVVAAATLLYAFMPTLNLLASQPKEDPKQKEAVLAEKTNVEAAVNAQLSKVKKLVADTPGLKELAEQIQPLELPDKPTTTPDDIRREALKQLDKVTDKLKQKQDSPQLDALKELKRELARLETPQGDDPGSKLAQSLSSGDMESARKALADLKKQLQEAAAKGDPEAKAKLEEMQQRLDDLAAKLDKLADMSKLEKELQNKGGLSQEDAKKLLDELSKMDPNQLSDELAKRLADSGLSPQDIKKLADKIAQQRQAMKQMKSLSKAMAKSAQACKNACENAGEGAVEAGAALAALSEVDGELSALEMSEQLLNELEVQLAELDKLREGVCQGWCTRPRPPDWNRIGSQGPQEGLGYGSRIGKERAAHQYTPEKVKAMTRQGQMIGQLLVDGPQAKGQASAEVREALDAALRDATDAIERERVLRQYEKLIRNYFMQLAGQSGAAAPKTGEPPEQPQGGAPSDD